MSALLSLWSSLLSLEVVSPSLVVIPVGLNRSGRISRGSTDGELLQMAHYLTFMQHVRRMFELFLI